MSTYTSTGSPTKTPLRKKRVHTTAGTTPGTGNARRRLVEAPKPNTSGGDIKHTTNTNTTDSRHDNHDELSLVGEEHLDQAGEADPDAKQHEEVEAQLRTKIESLKALLRGKDSEIKSLKDSLGSCQTQIATHDRNQKQIVKNFHKLYTEKHVAKVQALKQKYDKMYQDRVSELEARNEELNREISSLHADVDSLTSHATKLQTEVEQERKEKEELVSAYDQYFQLNGGV